MSERLEISATRAPTSGAWCCSALVRGFLVCRTYFDYTKREALAEFRRECAEESRVWR